MSSTLTLDTTSGLFHLPLELTLESGQTLEGGQLAYAFAGASDAPVVVVQGGISAGRHVVDTPSAAGWWPQVVRHGDGVDLARYRVLGIDFLGGDGASSGPGNHDSRPFPAVTSVDQARATSLLLDHLGIERVHAFVGASYGGMVALAAGAHDPARYERIVAISAPDRPHPLATGWRSIQRRVVRLGLQSGSAREALSIARGLAMTTYRGADELRERFDGAPTAEGAAARWPIEGYLEARGEAFADRVAPAAFLTLSEAIDRHRVEAGAITAAVTLVAVEEDQLVPLRQLRELAGVLGPRAQLVLLRSRYGHDAFLKEDEAIRALLAYALDPEGETP